MPRIRQYQSQVEAPQPSGAGVSALASIGASSAQRGAAWGDAARTIGNSLGQGIGAIGEVYQRREEEEEITRTATNASEFKLKKTLELQDFMKNADPADRDAPQRFADKTANDAEEFLSGLDLKTERGRVSAQRLMADLKSDLAVKAFMGHAELEGVAAQQSAVSMMNNLTSAVRADPNAYVNSRNIFEFYMQGSGLDATQQQKMRGEFTKELSLSRIYGIAQYNPDAAQAELDGGAHNSALSALDKETATYHIRTMANVQRFEEREKLEAQKQAQEKIFLDQVDGIFKKQPILPNGMRGSYPGMMRDIQNLPAVTPEQISRKFAMANDLEATIAATAGKGGQEDDPATVRDFRQRLYLPKSDPRHLTDTEVFNAFSNGLISKVNRDDFMEGINGGHSPQMNQAGKDFEDWLRGQGKSITDANPALGKLDPSGDARLADFEAQARTYFRDGLAAGLSMDEIKRQVISSVPRFVKSAQQLRDDLPKILRGELAPSVTTPQRWLPNSPMRRGFPDNVQIKGQQKASLAPEGMTIPGTQNPFDYQTYPKVANPDGTWSNVITVTEKIDDTWYLLPSMVGGVKVDPVRHFEETGDHFGAFDSAAAAETFAKQVEAAMQKEAPPLAQVPKAKPGETIQQWKARNGR